MLEKLKQKFLNKKFASFFVIGLINTALSQGLYIVFVIFNIPSGLSSLLSDSTIPMLVSYFLNMKFTYKKEMSWKSLVAFPISYIPGWIVNFICVLFCVYVLHVDEKFAKLFSIPITVPLNYLVMTYIVEYKKNTK